MLLEQSSLVCTNDFMRKKLLLNKIFAPGFCSIESNWLNMREPFAHLHLKDFCYLCTVNVIFQYGKGEQKHITKKVIKFPNQLTLLTLVKVIKIG